MECNKEEATRAKEVAETKMQNKDFSGAKKFALKAQQLYPDLENISQLLMVCDVHLSAESKSYGNEKNWYEILKIESTVDEILIKKQYRKFALLLHPDKNKFAGATDAFQLIGEAQRVLLDREKRNLYDCKIKNSLKNTTQPWAQNTFAGKTTPFTSFNPQHQQPLKQPQSTFWTMCPFCCIKYQYYRDVVNKNLHCQRCKKFFTGHEIKNHATATHTAWPQPNSSFMPQKREPVAKTRTSEVAKDPKVEPKYSKKVNIKRKKRIEESIEICDSDSSSESEEEDVIKENGNSKVEPKFPEKVNVKRKKRIEESSESCDSDSSSESGEEDVIKENKNAEVKKDFGENLRRSSRSRTKISYKENLSNDDDLGNFSKKKKSSKSFRANDDPGMKKEPQTNKFQASSKPMKEDDSSKVKIKETENGNAGLSGMKNGGNKSVNANSGNSPDSSPEYASVPEVYDYPDPEFNDFGKDKKEDCFAVGQIWAVYDTLDTMPRFYARINRIISTSGFKLRITWLELDPHDENEIKWVTSGLPVSCGEFTKGDLETTDKLLMFSHLVDWKIGNKKDNYKIYPRKGETWALFRNWDMNWYSDLKTRKNYEFEFVEILSDYCEDDRFSVAYLGKVKGFSCLFCRTKVGGVDSFEIPRNQLFRFSHRVPSFRLNGDESDNIPENSFELDPASLPSKVDEIDISKKNQKVEIETVVISEDSLENDIESDFEGNSDSSEENLEENEIPETEFFNFDGEKSLDKFQPCQIWALYSDEDGLPKYYAIIKNIVHQPKFKLNVTWLSPCPTKNTIKNAYEIPIGCGIFKLSKSQTSSYTNTQTFSHCLKLESTDKKHEYSISPRKGEVWAVYKNWNIRMTPSDLENCEYDIVEVFDENYFVIKVLVLEKVSGYNSVFKARKINGTLVVDQIVRPYLLKFSHQIPAFKLTGEKGGSLKGYWELDPAALPNKILRSS